ncbi:MAG: hypothetical protein M3Q23_18050 [Actinomycetota bacterium]|nr:hypothetical protein [Actinomycetota bacterium]
MRQLMRIFGTGVVLVVVSLAAVPAGASGLGSWTSAASMPTPRAALAAAVGSDDRIYALGGCCDSVTGDLLATNEAYDPSTNTWSSAAPMPTPRDFFAAAPDPAGHIYAIGGCCTGGSDFTATDVYDPSTNTWSSAAPMPTAREEEAAALGADGRIYVFGGCCSGGGNVLTTVEAYDPVLNTWSTAAPMPAGRADPGAVASGNVIYVIGGSDGTHHVSTVQAYNTSTNTWSTVAPLAGPRDNVAAALGSDGRIYAIGGCCGAGSSPLSTVEAYDTSTNSWSTVASLPAARDELAAAFGADGRTYAIGGSNSTFDDQDSLFAYTPGGASVTVTSATPAALGQGAQSAVVIKGSGFQSGATVTVSGTGVSVLSTTLISPTKVKVVVQVASNATVGSRNVTVTNPDTTSASCVGCLTIDLAPNPTSAVPNTGARGATLNVDIFGSDFQAGARARFGPKITVNSTTFVNSGQLTANITILGTATTGPRSVVVVNPDRGIGTCPNCFTVT